MKPHPHAENMRLYAEDAAETETPWERWEYRGDDTRPWMPICCPFHFHPGNQYRRKPRTITINGHEVPEPCREALEVGRQYWLVDLHHIRRAAVCDFQWSNCQVDREWLRRGLIHLTREAAAAHAAALLSFTTEEETE